MKNLLIGNPFANYAKNKDYFFGKNGVIGLECRKNIVLPKFISLCTDLFYTTCNDEKPILDINNAMNWSDFWEVDKKGNLVHPRLVEEWLIFHFGTDRALWDLFYRRGIPEVVCDKIVDGRNTLMNHGGNPESTFKHKVGILFIGNIKAHAAVKKILAGIDFKIECVIVNGDHTSNKECKRLIKKGLKNWAGKNDDDAKFLILMDGMGNRSLSIPQISFAVYTGNNPSDASFDQKTARVRTEFGNNKEAFVVDCSLSKNFEFHAEALVRQYAKSKGVSDVVEVIDKFHQFDTFMVYTLELAKLEAKGYGTQDYLRPLTNVDYVNLCRQKSDAQIGECVWDDLKDDLVGLVMNETTKKLNGKPEIEIESGAKGTHTIERKTKKNEDEDEGKKKDRTPTPPEKKVILEMVKDIFVPGFCMAYSVDGEDAAHPVVDRWNFFREMWIDSHAKKYGGEADCRTNWEWFIGKVKRNAYINARLVDLGKKIADESDNEFLD